MLPYSLYVHECSENPPGSSKQVIEAFTENTLTFCVLLSPSL